MNIKQQEKALQAKRKALLKQVDGIERELGILDEVNAGDRPVPEIARLIKSQRFSYTVEFTRKKELRKVAKPGLTFTSNRRFATAAEAGTHGRRFQKKHGHKSFEVVRVNKRANAWVNPRTGKTNPVVGL